MASTTLSASSVKPVASARVSNRTASVSAPVQMSRSAFQGQAVQMNTKKSSAEGRGALQVCAALSDLRDRIASVKNTQKITDAMKLVAAAKVRRAQAAVLDGRPFAETLIRTLASVQKELDGDDLDVPLVEVRPVKKVLLISVSGDRGLCGGFNTFAIKKTMERVASLKTAGVDVQLMTVGKKGCKFFDKRKDEYNLIKQVDIGGRPTSAEAREISSVAARMFTEGEVDKVEVIYTKFISLIKGDPVVQTLLPLSSIPGKIVTEDGIIIDAEDDEMFKLTSEDGALGVAREKTFPDGIAGFRNNFFFESSPESILDLLLTMYVNSTVLRSFQESVASELAARMSAMSAASDNAKELKKNLSLSYNRQRQAKITAEIIELCSGSG